MHSEVGKSIVHGNIRSWHILLDDNLKPKLTGCHLSWILEDSRQGEYVRTIRYTPQNLDPVYVKTGYLSTKVDVYSFGVILLELFTRQEAFNSPALLLKLLENPKLILQLFSAYKDEGSPLLASKFQYFFNNGNVHELIDQEIGDEINALISDFIDLVRDCLSDEIEHRPNMREVAHRLQAMLIACDKDFIVSENLKRFTKVEVENMTQHYHKFLGQGASGKVYLGKTDGDQQVAVKVFTQIENELKRFFMNEVKALSFIHHENVVKLLGFSLDWEMLVLIYEYVSNGDLYDLLHKTNQGRYTSISWKQRLQIAEGSARGLVFMHNMPDHPIIHGDIKSANILLDHNFAPKLADFGLSRVLNCKTTLYTSFILGTTGYVDPMFSICGRLTPMSDVYSFGIILLELVTRREAVDDENNHLGYMLWHAHKKNEDITDKFDRDIWTEATMDSMLEVVMLAFECINQDPDERPTMKKVADELKKILEKIVTADYKSMEMEAYQKLIQMKI